MSGNTPEPDLGGALDQRLATWTADARADERIAQRRREQWLRQAARDEATFVGVLVDLAEREVPVVVETRAGRRHRGVPRTVSAEVVLLESGAGMVVVRVAAITTVQPRSTDPIVVGAGQPSTRLSLVDALAGFAADRPRVVVTSGLSEPLRGTLHAVGQDVLVIRPELAGAADLYVRARGVDEVLVEPRD